MLGEIDTVDFLVAETTGSSLGQVRALPNAEIVEWRAFLTYRHAMQDFASRQAAARRR